MPQPTDHPIAPDAHPAAAVWNAGGRNYDLVSFAISDALAHAAQRLAPTPGTKVLDCATGTGWTARNAARMGGVVTAVDIAPELLAAARELSDRTGPRIDFRLADAEALPFEDAAFDAVISTFGVMFAADHERAAAELSRVCRRGGRMVLATWTPDGAVAEFFGLMGAHAKDPPPAHSPLQWGDPAYLQSLLADAFELKFEPGVSRAYHESPEAIWRWYLDGFGPLKHLYRGLDASARATLERDVHVYHEHYQMPAGLCVRREYLITIGTRR